MKKILLGLGTVAAVVAPVASVVACVPAKDSVLTNLKGIVVQKINASKLDADVKAAGIKEVADAKTAAATNKIDATYSAKIATRDKVIKLADSFINRGMKYDPKEKTLSQNEIIKLVTAIDSISGDLRKDLKLDSLKDLKNETPSLINLRKKGKTITLLKALKDETPTTIKDFEITKFVKINTKELAELLGDEFSEDSNFLLNLVK